MPYITTPEREVINPSIDAAYKSINTVGQLNYAITRLCYSFWRDHMGYQAVADITGILHNVACEMYRRVFSVYEDDKIYTNGDVF